MLSTRFGRGATPRDCAIKSVGASNHQLRLQILATSINIVHIQSSTCVRSDRNGGSMKNRTSRRQFLTTTTAAPVALAIANGLQSTAAGANPGPGNWVSWLDKGAPTVAQGVTWGTPWPRGKVKSAKNFALRNSGGSLVPLQSW